MRLTDISIRAIPQPERGVKVYHDDTLKGFGIRVSQAGAKSFVVTTGKNRDRITIGRYPLVGLAQARDIARRLLAERTLGRHHTPRTTVAEALQLYTEQHTTKLAPRTQKELARLFARYLTKHQAKKLSDLTAHHITAVTDKAAPSEAEHFHRAMRAFLRWCVARKLLEHSPVEGLPQPSKWKPRERVLTDDELRAVWTHSRTRFGTIVRLLMVTGQRRSEIAAIQPDWFTNNTLCFPSTITKNRRPHSIPCGKTTSALLGGSSLHFNGWSKAKAALDKRAQIEPWTLHDLRRTYATNLQRLGIKLEVIEALLNHISGTRAGIVGVYQRHNFWNEMVDAVNRYDEWFTKTIAGEEA